MMSPLFAALGAVRQFSKARARGKGLSKAGLEPFGAEIQ